MEANPVSKVKGGVVFVLTMYILGCYYRRSSEGAVKKSITKHPGACEANIYRFLFPSPSASSPCKSSNTSLLSTQDSSPASVMKFSGAHRAAITARRAHKAPPTEATDLTADPVKGTIELEVTPPEDAGEPVAVAAPLLTG